MDSDTNSEDMNEEYKQQVIAEEMEIDELVLVVARTSIYYHNNFLVKEPCKNSPHTGWKFMMKIMDGNGRRCHEMFRMEKHVFCKLCDRLRRNRMIQEHFQHSCETVSRQFSNVLEKMSMLALDEIRPPENFDEVPYYIRNNPTYWPYFKDCIGAIEGTHVRVSLPVDKQRPCIGRKGKYYLVDAGYPNMKYYLAPYKGTRYHLPQFQQGSQPSGSKEVFNHAHSSLCSVIERCFGVWEARWEILQRMSNYKFDKQPSTGDTTFALRRRRSPPPPDDDAAPPPFGSSSSVGFNVIILVVLVALLPFYI
ncbi:uncharacterized protein LOC133778963 [Humulus lupulus]|uniref:uncharacterized protein LOC133778963 n=1 Tax=Humulus lupulus TaxID=3486 RepID=UPI002B40E603|nr:uncharacterized protein LOC133778963 [Humulus lupulus]